ncbi:phosphate-starvation-inducible PsiE family protein [Methylomonas albis]|uniref:Phosphate-starvation-inducible PsiE family protein n=1 Tax=Methylomonas albis TaxID=1854563 RepID=A0ABR9D6U4_9GAMM|nr:phosphate-starvation-inducible PsiE family protein [Methylomonas albis]MBD9358788.1 phosphate-starvation-inducible PsiE family protein [Methylomonas albis]
MKNHISSWRNFCKDWDALTFYQRFESGVAFALTFLVMLVVSVALFRLFVGVIGGLVFDALNPLDHEIFQQVFGEIMTLLIALEFNHTLQYVVTREQSVIQTKVVLLIAMLALARKFIVLDLGKTSADVLLALAAATLVLGVTYWLVRERDDRLLEIQRSNSKLENR